MKRGFVLAAAALVAASPALAAGTVIVSGDSNIFNAPILANAGNTGFMDRLGGSNVLIRTSGIAGFGAQSADLASFYNARGVAAGTVASNTAITASLLSGVSLFVAIGPTDAFTGSEVAAISSFLGGGGRLMLVGEFARNAQGGLAPSNAAINTNINNLLAGLNNPMRLSLDTPLVAGLATGSVATVTPLTAGLTSIQYAAATEALGGVTLFNTANGLGFIAGTGVPEPANWAMLIAGFGLVGAMQRRRRHAIA
jgi:hypothetical protein